MRIGLCSAIFALSGSLALAQERCDAPSPAIFCNTTEILAYQSQDCTPFHVFVVRGSDEPTPGRLGNLTMEVCSAIGGTDDCGYEDVEYPAKSSAWGQNAWCDSAAEGAKNGQAQMNAYSEKCPDSKLIVLGFSQGGSVAQDMLGGGGGPTFACEQDSNPALDASVAPGSNVIAAVTFGAVARSKGQSFIVGDGGENYDGTRARTPEQLQGLNQYADVLLDYCHHGDPICAVGSEPQQVVEHLNYFLEHNEAVTEWVAAMAKASDGDTSAKPSKPVISSSAATATTSVAARPAVTGSASATPSESASASLTDAQVAAQQTGAEGAASSVAVVALGYLTTALVVTVTVLF